MKVIHIRDSPNWDEMTEEKFVSQKFLFNQESWQRLINKMLPKVKTWNKLSKMSYFKYRHELQKIHKDNIKKIKADIVTFEEMDLSTLDDFIFLAIDDDDWYASNVFDVLQQHQTDDTEVFMWRNRLIDKNGNLFERSEKQLFTNNYAFTKKGWAKIKSFPDSPINKLGQSEANSVFHPCYWVESRLKSSPFNITYIEKELSVTVKSLASASVLAQTLENEFLNQFKKISKIHISIQSWEDEVNQFNELNSKCKIKMIL